MQHKNKKVDLLPISAKTADMDTKIAITEEQIRLKENMIAVYNADQMENMFELSYANDELDKLRNQLKCMKFTDIDVELANPKLLQPHTGIRGLIIKANAPETILYTNDYIAFLNEARNITINSLESKKDKSIYTYNLADQSKLISELTNTFQSIGFDCAKIKEIPLSSLIACDLAIQEIINHRKENLQCLSPDFKKSLKEYFESYIYLEKTCQIIDDFKKDPIYSQVPQDIKTLLERWPRLTEENSSIVYGRLDIRNIIPDLDGIAKKLCNAACKNYLTHLDENPNAPKTKEKRKAIVLIQDELKKPEPNFVTVKKLSQSTELLERRDSAAMTVLKIFAVVFTLLLLKSRMFGDKATHGHGFKKDMENITAFHAFKSSLNDLKVGKAPQLNAQQQYNKKM